jgi:hypothetical protein
LEESSPRARKFGPIGANYLQRHGVDSDGKWKPEERMNYRNEQSRVVLGLGESKLATQLADELRQLGWDVRTAETGEEARREAVRESAHAVVVPFQSHDQLGTAKVVSAVPGESSVVLVSPSASVQAVRFASLIGVAMAAESGGVAGIVSAVEGVMLIKA